MNNVVRYLYKLNLSKTADRFGSRMEWYTELTMLEHRCLSLGLDGRRFYVHYGVDSCIRDLLYYLLNRDKVLEKAKRTWNNAAEKARTNEKWEDRL